MIDGADLTIDLEALAANFRLIQRQVAPARVGGVIKANGYGLGAREVVWALEAQGCEDFFVALLGEALAVAPYLSARSHIYVLNGLLPGTEANCAKAGIIPVLNSLDQVGRWSAEAESWGGVLPAALQVDTGMARMGLPATELNHLLATPSLLEGIDLRFLISHLACADELAAPANVAQVTRFEAMAEHFPSVPRALDNSGGAFHERGHFDLVRAGIALYGGEPRAGYNPMQPVISLKTRIAQVRTIAEGESVGYGLTFRAGRSTRIATIPVGYADGWPRSLGNKGAAFIDDIRVPFVGRVSMDSITLDVTDVPDDLTLLGTPVELIGSHQTIDQVALDAGTIAYEILTQLSRRYRRTYRPFDANIIDRSIAV